MVARILACLLLLAALCHAGPLLVSNKGAYATRGPQPTVGSEMVVTIDVYNVGDAPALEVTIADAWNPELYTIVSGALSATFDSIAPGANASHSLVVIPRVAGFAESRRATVDYRDAAGTEHRSVSSALEGLQIYTSSQVDLLGSSGPHFKEWSVFLAFSLLSLGGPAIVYWSSHAQAAALAAKGK